MFGLGVYAVCFLGNTALHLAVMLGRKGWYCLFWLCHFLNHFIVECVQLLLKHDAPVKVKNGLGWTVLAEAVSYGNRPTSKFIAFQSKLF